MYPNSIYIYFGLKVHTYIIYIYIYIHIYIYVDYFKDKVYTIWVHGPLGTYTCVGYSTRRLGLGVARKTQRDVGCIGFESAVASGGLETP